MIDWTRVAELRDEIGAEDFDEIVEVFLDEVNEAVDGLPRCAQGADMAGALHFLKGSALNLGFQTLADACRENERSVASGVAADIEAIATTYAQARAAFLHGLGEMSSA